MIVSVVVPVRDEVQSLEALCRELLALADERDETFEIVFVDDGSTDGSWATIQRLAEGDKRVLGVSLRKGFGKGAALSAGFNAATGEVLCMIDGDGQDVPAEIGRCLDRLAEGADFVNGWRKNRIDPFTKTLPSRVFNWLANRLSGMSLGDHNCGLKVMRRAVVEELRFYGELYRFLPVLADERGFSVVECEVEHRPRQHGASKYGGARFMRGFLDLLMVRYLTGFRGRPQHAIGGLGLISFLVSLAILSYLAATWVLRIWYPESYLPLSKRPLTIYAVGGLVFGAQMLSLGFIAGLLPHYFARDEAMYSIAKKTR